MSPYNDKDEEGDKKKKGDNHELLKEARERLQSAWDYDQDNREEALKDLKFIAGDQWPEDVRQERENAGRPCLTLDHLNQYKNQVVNDIRQAKIGIKAVGVDSNSDMNLAEIFTALMRDIQHKSSAPHVYASAADGAVSCGIGHFRFETRYVDDAVFEQEVCIKHIPYPLAVFWDPASVLPDRSDAMWCFVVEFIPKLAFDESYPEASAVDVDVPSDGANASGLYWATKEGTLVAEYWKKKKTKRRLVAFEDGQTFDVTNLGKEDLAKIEPLVKAERQADSYEIEHCLITGQEILEGPAKWAGRHIPIIPVIATEVHLERKVVRFGLIRLARDAQQLYNYWRTSAAELIALAPKAKWLVTAKMIATRIGEWAKAHISPTPYLQYDYDSNAPNGKPELIPPPSPPAAIWQEAALVVDDIKAALGMYDASVGAKSNETSGIAIARRQQEGDVANYHFADNLTRSLEHGGRVLIDLIPKIYDSQRIIRIMGDDDTQDFIQINTPAMNVDGEPVLLNDLSQGKFDVRVSIGPSYTTQRLEAAESMIEYLKVDPEAIPFIRDKVVKALDWPGADEISERLKRTIPPQVLGPDEQPEAPPPDPSAQQANELALKEQGAKVAETEGKARKVHAEADAQEMENAVNETQVSQFGVPPPQHALPPDPGAPPSSP